MITILRWHGKNISTRLMQNIRYVDFDTRPRRRELVVQILGE